MALIIDTMNVMHAWTALRTGQAHLSVTGLNRLISASRYASRRVRMVCDGPAPADWPARVELPLDAASRATAIYAGPGRDADSLIERLLDEDPGVRHTTVVSADRRLIRAAKRRKATPLNSTAFLHQLLHDAREAGLVTPDPSSRIRSAIPLAQSTVEGWLRFFRITDTTQAASKPATQRRSDNQPSRPHPSSPAISDPASPKPSAAQAGPAAHGTPVSIEDAELNRLIREALASGLHIDPAELDMSKWVD